MNYQNLKDWLSQKENKNKLVLGVSFILVFLVGFGTGDYKKSTEPVLKTYANYTTNQNVAPLPDTSRENDQTPARGTGTKAKTSPKSAAPDHNCPIKGNISASSGKKIYHVPGGAFYSKVKPEQCFSTETAAQAAGFVKSRR